MVAGVAVSQGTASSCAARARLSVATKEDQVREDRGGSVMGATWLADEDGDRFLRGVRCSERGEGRVARESAYVHAEFAGGRCVGAASPGGL